MLSSICNTPVLLHNAIISHEKVVLEGAQGSFLDVDHGTYPFVTSSSTTAGGACTGSGIAPRYIGNVYGIFKAYTTRVGEGPFPTELQDAVGEKLRAIGHEYGATTKRPRRCGWFDAVLAKHSILVNGMTGIILTKLDVLSSFEEIKICVGYEYNEKHLDVFPSNVEILSHVKPIYVSVPGWNTDISFCRSVDQLPDNCQAYIKKLEEAIGNPISVISVGPEREQTIFVE